MFVLVVIVVVMIRVLAKVMEGHGYDDELLILILIVLMSIVRIISPALARPNTESQECRVAASALERRS